LNLTLQKKITDHRKITFGIAAGERLSSQKDAIDFVNRRSFVLFHPTKDALLPSLWVATAGDRPVPNQHDDPGHITWQWKDTLLDQRVWFYGRLVRKRMTMVSLEFFPNFYALSPNFGDYENDYLVQYKAGNLIYEAKQIYEALLDNGPLNTLDLRKKAGLGGTKNQYRFTKGINHLQTELKIAPVGIAEAGRWNYSFIYDIVPRYYPEIEQSSRNISISQAEKRLVGAYLSSVGASSEEEIRKLFSWTVKRTQKALQELLSDPTKPIQQISAFDGNGAIYYLSELLI